MLEEILLYMGNLNPEWIYVVLFFFAFIENIFPPSPSDLIVIVGASLIASTSLGFIPVLILTSIASSLGFIAMYYLGFFLSERVLRAGKLSFLDAESIQKTDAWFGKYGYKLILANRFLPGTRSVISFFAGVSELNVWRTFILATISAFLWNVIIVRLGMWLGNNVELIDYYLSTYSKMIIILTVIVALFFTVRYFIKRKK
ncbi:MAG: DedA family protein [Bacteroidetes bacterium]|nr:DedA family protein [Bacteroidota bacterium]